MSVQATITCVIFVITILLLVFKPIPIIITGAIIPTALALFGIIKADTAFADFTNSTSIFMICFCIIGSAFFKTGLADFLGTKIIGVLGKNEKGLLAGTGIVAGGLSAFLNDTGSTACMMPIVSSMAEKAGVKRSRLLLALSYFASLGGCITLAGTTPHIVANGILKDNGLPEFAFFEYAKIGVPLLIVGILYMMFVGVKLLPDRDIDVNVDGTKDYNLKKMPYCAAIFVFTILAMATEVIPIMLAGVIGSVLVVLTGCITMDEAIKAIPVSSVFLVGGVFPISKALVSTGAAEFFVTQLSPVLAGFSPLALLGGIAALQLLITQFLMNSSATVLVLPIALMLCQAAGINPLAGAMVVSICASGVFASPFGAGNNLIVMEAGGYTIQDFVKCGLPLVVLFGIVTTVLCAVIYL